LYSKVQLVTRKVLTATKIIRIGWLYFYGNIRRSLLRNIREP